MAKPARSDDVESLSRTAGRLHRLVERLGQLQVGEIRAAPIQRQQKNIMDVQPWQRGGKVIFNGSPRALMVLGYLTLDRQSRTLSGGEVQRIGNCDFLLPTLIAEVDHGMELMREETFGPVLPVMRVDDDNTASRLVGDTRYGLTSSIFTVSRERAEAFISTRHSGTVYVNCCNYVDARLGWIGHGHSGNGSIALSPAGLQAFSALRSVNINPKRL